MKWLITLTLAILFSYTPAYAQSDVVVNGTQVTWDYDIIAEGVETFNVYMDKIPGIVPNTVLFVGSTPFPGLLWTLLAPGNGKWYMVVTAVNTTAVVESGPSNEIELIVIGKPTNLRIAELLAAKVGLG